MRECHIFIAITNKVRSNKMIAIRRRTFIIKVLFFISIPPFFLKIGGRHSHQMLLLELYIKRIYKTSEQEMFFIKFQIVDNFNLSNHLFFKHRDLWKSSFFLFYVETLVM